MTGLHQYSWLALTAGLSETLIPILIGVFGLIAVGLVIAGIIVIKTMKKNNML